MPKQDSSSPLTALLDAVVAAFGKSALIAKESYLRVVVEKRTVGYVNPGAKALRVDVPSGNNGYDKFKVSTAADVRKAVAAMKKAAV